MKVASVLGEKPRKRIGVLSMMTPEEARANINPTAAFNYSEGGAGIGDQGAVIERMKLWWGLEIAPTDHVLDVGFGGGGLLMAAYEAGAALVCGVDIAPASLDAAKHLFQDDQIPASFYILDVSHERLPWKTDSLTLAFSTETLEHVANPIHMFAEVKRVLRHGSLFIVAFPMPEDNLGYDGGEHSHAIPGFLERANFELFCKQTYFKIMNRQENGSTVYYVLKNYKGPGVTDIFRVLAGNYTEEALFKCLEEF